MSIQGRPLINLSPDEVRRSWFQGHGYKGDPDEVVTLRTVGEEPLGTATVADVWEVVTGLNNVKGDSLLTLFRRAIVAAAENERPIDHPRRLAERNHGSITDPDTGEFRPGRREIILALFDVDLVNVTISSAEAPLVRPEAPAAQAA